ncbi:MAG: DUF1428 domain-containing protein [Bacteroidetes bacterium]|nr:DUF1428 domain-containing protein [Bacteroidota bacterium]MCY4206163.1 DUF1428 domain-containing protein [Bacteroidota bacterium]
MSYIEGFVFPVPTENKERYLKHARDCVPIFKKYGALRLVENWGVSISQDGDTSFSKAVKKQPHETVMFSWVVWPSKEVRDEGMEKLFKDPFFAEGYDLPFDEKRMIYGGFETILDE